MLFTRFVSGGQCGMRHDEATESCKEDTILTATMAQFLHRHRNDGYYVHTFAWGKEKWAGLSTGNRRSGLRHRQDIPVIFAFRLADHCQRRSPLSEQPKPQIIPNRDSFLLNPAPLTRANLSGHPNGRTSFFRTKFYLEFRRPILVFMKLAEPQTTGFSRISLQSPCRRIISGRGQFFEHCCTRFLRGKPRVATMSIARS